MRILHLASFDRWSGAAAPALSETTALRDHGIDAFYVFTAGGKLERKVADLDYAIPALYRGQTPRAVIRSVAAVRDLAREIGVDVIHSHLSHDHWVGYMVRRGLGEVKLARTFHAFGKIRTDLLHRHLLRETDGIAVVNPSISSHSLLDGCEPLVTPVPADPAFTPEGHDLRRDYGIGEREIVLGVIGKLVEERGFQDVLRTFRIFQVRHPDSRLLLIGHGPYEDSLRQLAADLGIADRIVWTGYTDDDLPGHHRTMDALLFVAGGSDEGHRATVEAMACGTPPVCWPVRGLEFVLGELSGQLITAERSHESLAERCDAVLSLDRGELHNALSSNAARFSSERTASRLIAFYESLLEDGPGP